MLKKLAIFLDREEDLVMCDFLDSTELRRQKMKRISRRDWIHTEHW